MQLLLVTEETSYYSKLQFFSVFHWSAYGYSAVDNFFCGWCTVHIMLVKFGVPKNWKVYRYDYHVKNLIIVMIA